MNEIDKLVKELIHELLNLNLEELRKFKEVQDDEMNKLNRPESVVTFCNMLVDLVIEKKLEKVGTTL